MASANRSFARGMPQRLATGDYILDPDVPQQAVAADRSVQLGAILDFSDAMVFVICVPNVLGLYLLAPFVKRELQSYRTRVASGEIPNYRNG